MLISIGRFSLDVIRGCLGLTHRKKCPSPLEPRWRLPPDLTVRAADEADAEAMQAVHAASYGVAYAWHPPELRSAILHDAKEIGTRGRDPQRPWHHLVAEIGGRMVGFVRYCCFSTAPDTAPAIFMSMLYVHPDFQRRGIGSELLALCAGRHPAVGRIILNIATQAREAPLFYRRHGFGPVNRGTLTLADGTIEVDVVYLSADVACLARSRLVVQPSTDTAAIAPA